MIKKLIAFMLLVFMLPSMAFVSAAQELGETVVFEQDFQGLTELPEGWISYRGEWSIAGGKLRQTYVTDPYADPEPAVLTFGENPDLKNLANFRFEATVIFETAALSWSWIGLGFDICGKEPFTYAGFSWETSNPESIGTTFGFYSDNSEYSQHSAYGAAPKDMSDGEAARIRVEVRGKYGDIYFNDIPVIINAEIPRWENGALGLIMGYGGTGSYSDIKITKLPGDEDGFMADRRIGEEAPGGLEDYREWLEPEFAKGDYRIAIVPDIQNMTRCYPSVLGNMIDWIRDNTEKLNIKFMIQVGDLTDANTGTEWARVRDNLAKLDGILPYAFVLGNHDYANSMMSGRDSSAFNIYLPYSKYSKTPYFGGAFEEGKMDNTYYFFTAGDTDYMALCLEVTPRDPVVEWANKIVADNPGCSVIVTTHSYLSYTGEHDNFGGYGTAGSSGKILWENLVSLHENIIMVLSGHLHHDDIVMRTETGINGNIIQQFLTDAQDMDYYREGIGMIALMTFNNNGRDVAVNWYSTKENALFRDRNQFSFKFDAEAPESGSSMIFILIIGGIALSAVLILAVIIIRSVIAKSSV